MTTRTLLRIVAPVTLAAAVLAACGADTSTVSSKRPAVIRIGSGSNSAPAAADGALAESALDSKMAFYQPANFTLADGLAAPQGPRRAWSFPAAAAPVTDAQKSTLLAAFGLSGTWQQAPADQGGHQYSGDGSKGEPSLTIGTDAMRSWWYSPAWTSTPTVGCVEPAVSEPAAESNEAAGSGEGSSTGASAPDSPDSTAVDADKGDSVTEVDGRPECVPQPPANVPTKAEAEASTRALIDKLGLDPANYQFESYADDWGAYVTAWLVLDGMRTPLAMGVGFGAEGAITGASGFLAQPVPGDEYDLVTLEQAVERMNAQDGRFWGGWYGGAAAMVRGGIAVDTAVAPASGAVEDSSAGTDSSTDPGLTPESVPGVPASEGSEGSESGEGTVEIDPMPPVTAEPVEAVEVALTGVTMGLAQLWDADGNIWLLPAYVFTDANGGQYTVYAIGDEYLDFTATTVVDETLVDDTVMTDDMVVSTDADATGGGDQGDVRAKELPDSEEASGGASVPSKG